MFVLQLLSFIFCRFSHLLWCLEFIHSAAYFGGLSYSIVCFYCFIYLYSAKIFCIVVQRLTSSCHLWGPQFKFQLNPSVIFLECGRKLEYPDETHQNISWKYKLHAGVDLGWIWTQDPTKPPYGHIDTTSSSSSCLAVMSHRLFSSTKIHYTT